MKYFQVSNLNSKALDIETEQKKDLVLRKVMTWIDTASMLAIESVQEIEAKPTVPKDLIEKIQCNYALQDLIPNLDGILKSASKNPNFTL